MRRGAAATYLNLQILSIVPLANGIILLYRAPENKPKKGLKKKKKPHYSIILLGATKAGI